jgi:hypothetical protein
MQTPAPPVISRSLLFTSKSQTWTIASTIIYLPPDSSRRTKEIFIRNQSIIEAIGSRTFRFQRTWNPNPTIWSSLDKIFFGEDSVCTSNLNQLLTMIGRNKKSFRDQIALDNFFATKFLFAINKRFQHWLRLCKTAHNSRTQVNNRILQFEDLINTVLNGTFHMNLPPSFAKVGGSAATSSASTESKQADGKNKGGSKDRKGQKKQKSDDGNGNLVKNITQPVKFKLTTGELWKDNFATILPHN